MRRAQLESRPKNVHRIICLAGPLDYIDLEGDVRANTPLRSTTAPSGSPMFQPAMIVAIMFRATSTG